MKELILNFFSFGLAVSLERFLSFLLIPLYASVFSVTEFGVIDLVQTFIGVVTIFCFLQLETSLQRFYYEYEGEEYMVNLQWIQENYGVLTDNDEDEDADEEDK